MKRREFFAEWGLDSLSLNFGFLEAEFTPNDVDSCAAWEMYIELLTRVTTQALSPYAGDEETTLKSLYSLFGITRNILRDNGPQCEEFAKIAIPVLNQILRPFTAKWHKKISSNDFNDPTCRMLFNEELKDVQALLIHYSKALAAMARVEDLTNLEG